MKSGRQGGPVGGRGGAFRLVVGHEGEGVDRLKRTEEKRARQLMLDAGSVNGKEGLQGPKPEELMEKAFKAVNKVVNPGLLEGRPEMVEFTGATLQWQGGVLFERKTKEAREWLVCPDVCEKFIDRFGWGAQLRHWMFPVLVKFVPVEFSTSREDAIKVLEETNNLLEGSIMSLKWVWDPKRCEPEQRYTHLIVYCNSKETANNWIFNSRVIEGNMVLSIKLLPEPMRSYNCQLDSHQAKAMSLHSGLWTLQRQPSDGPMQQQEKPLLCHLQGERSPYLVHCLP